MDKTNYPEEIVDVVDENDAVIGKATRGEVNRDPRLIHREIAVLIYDGEGRVFVQQRSQAKDVMPLVWTLSAAGHIPSGVPPDEAARMELEEELGFQTELRFRYKARITVPTESVFSYLYIGQIPEGAAVRLNLDEAAQGRFVSEAELDEMIAQGEAFDEYSLREMRRFFRGERL
jgi:isopentenyl-diphosphate delta-isomerase